MSLQWLSLVGAIWLQSITGTNSDFPAYSSQLKQLLSLSQLQLNNLAFASDAGKLFGFVAGFSALYLPLWLVLWFGSVLGLVGYGVQYLFLVGKIAKLSYYQACILTVLSGNSICWINTVCYIVTIHNFPLDRVHAVGLITSYSGLSAKVYTDIVAAFFPSSPTERAKGYLLLNSILPLGVSILSAPLVCNINVRKSRKMQDGFMIMFFITIATGIYAVVTSFINVSTGSVPLILLIGMGVLLLVPLIVPITVKFSEKIQKKCLIRIGKIKVHAENMEEEGNAQIEKVGVDLEIDNKVDVKGDNEDDEIKEIRVWKMVMKIEFWLYFFVYLFGATLGLVYMNNLGQIAESRGCARTSSLVSLSSSFGFFGRLLPSLLIYILSRIKCKASTPVSIATIMAPMSGAFFLLLQGSDISLYISTATIGLCTGAISSIAVSTTTELFGAKDFSVNHNIVVANIPIGSYFFGGMAAKLYKKARYGNHGPCLGMECYRTTFIIWGTLCCVGSFLALILHKRTRKL